MTSPNIPDNYLTSAQAAQLLGCSASSIQRAAYAGRIKRHKVTLPSGCTSKQYYYELEEVSAMADVGAGAGAGADKHKERATINHKSRISDKGIMVRSIDGKEVELECPIRPGAKCGYSCAWFSTIEKCVRGTAVHCALCKGEEITEIY